MTELGEIPENWDVKQLKEISTRVTDGVHATPKYTDGGIAFISANNLTSGKIKFGNCKYISAEDHEILIKRCKPEKGDLLFTKVGTLGITDVVECDDEFSIFVQLALIKLNVGCDSHYIKYQLNSEKTRNRVLTEASGTTMQYIGIGQISELPILVPPLSEQQKIADILSAVDEKIDQTDQLIAKTKELKKGLLKKLLTQGIGHKEFKHTEIGEIPAEWEVKQIGDVADYINGRAFKPNEWETSGIPIVRIQNLNGSSEFNYCQKNVEQKYYIDHNELLFSWSGSRGTSFGPFIWKKDKAVLNQHIFKVQIYQNIYKLYLYYALKYITELIEKNAHGSAGLVHITKKHLERFLIPVPSFVEQQKIADILLSVDEQIMHYESEKQSLQKLKQGLMQKLLTGKIRVTA